MRQLRFSPVHFYYLLIVALALTVRLVNLGASPLSDSEASWALQALSVARGENISIGPQPFYVLWTGFLFWLLDSSNFLARFLPALAGAALTISPYFFRKWIGGKSALFLGLGLALDPGLVGVSRQAGSPILAVGFVLFALGFAFLHRPVLAGVFLGLALISGPALIPGCLGIFLAWMIVRWLERNEWLALLERPQEDGEPGAKSVLNSRTMLVAAGGTLLFAGTLFFRVPQVLGAWLAIVPDYLVGWLIPSSVPALALLVSLLVYQTLPLFFAVVSGVRAWRGGTWSSGGDGFVWRLFVWFFVAILLAMVYPARQMSDLVWVLLPLWGLAALSLADLAGGFFEQKLVSFSQAAFVIVLLVLFWLQLAGLGQALPEGRFNTLRIGMIVAVFVLGSLVTVMVALGWSHRIAWQGLGLGLLVSLGIYTLSGMWGVSQRYSDLERLNRFELWYLQPVTGQADLLERTAKDLSFWHTGRRDSAELLAVDIPSLRWVLRSLPKTRYIPANEALVQIGDIAPEELPPIIISRQDQEAPSLAAIYRGQDFPWQVYPYWSGALPDDFLKWLVFRQTSIRREKIILWARADLFPGGLLSPSGQVLEPDDGVFPEEVNPVE
jgi:hypothetical protein